MLLMDFLRDDGEPLSLGEDKNCITLDFSRGNEMAASSLVFSAVAWSSVGAVPEVDWSWSGFWPESLGVIKMSTLERDGLLFHCPVTSRVEPYSFNAAFTSTVEETQWI